MKTLQNIFVWAILSFIIASSTLAVWTLHIDGNWIDRPVVFYKPHAFELPITSHPNELVEPYGVTHQTTKSHYRSGEMVQAWVNLRKNRDIVGMVQWSLMDQRFYPYVARRGVVPVGTHHLIVNIELIPRNIAPGQFHFSGQATYQINYFKTLSIPIKTNCFEVVEDEK